MNGHTKAAAKTISVLTAAVLVVGCFGSAAGRSLTVYTPSSATFLPVVVPTATPSPSVAPEPSVGLAPPVSPTPRPTRKPAKPRGTIGTALQVGYATYCAPTPTHCQRWGGGALLGAVPSFKWGDKPYKVTVRHGDRSVVVTVVSYCACGDRKGKRTLIDLSPAAFARLAPLSRGVIAVTVER